MSGIIGGAGSKSGVIGITELDYETGTFTPTGSNVNPSGGKYMKIGQNVFCTVQITATGGGMASTIGGLPFTSASGQVGAGGAQSSMDANPWRLNVGGSVSTAVIYSGFSVQSLNENERLICNLAYVTDL
jgi:hypothetical protein